MAILEVTGAIAQTSSRSFLHMHQHVIRHARLLLLGAAVLAAACARSGDKPAAADSTAKSTTASAPAACPGDNAGLTLPPGFCATVSAVWSIGM